MNALDPLSNVLSSIRLKGAVFLDAQLTEPWAISSQLTQDDCRHFLAESAQVIAFHIVLEGCLTASIEGEPVVEVEQGQIILIPRNEPHQLASATGIKPVDLHNLMETDGQGGMFQVRYGGGGTKTRILCGYLASEHSFNPVIEILPRLLRVDTRTATSRDWMDASVRYAVTSATDRQFASSNVMARLSELLLIEAVRQYSATRSADEAGWLRGVQDRQVGRTLSLMHRDIAAPWSAESLAEEAGMSRSAFVDRFSRVVGMPPIRYLTKWRLEVARHQLRNSTKTVQQLAPTVGYASEEAFSRAFKREFGISPSEWRDQAALPAG